MAVQKPHVRTKCIHIEGGGRGTESQSSRSNMLKDEYIYPVPVIGIR